MITGWLREWSIPLPVDKVDPYRGGICVIGYSANFIGKATVVCATLIVLFTCTLFINSQNLLPIFKKVFWFLVSPVKGAVSGDFRLLDFFMNQFPPSTWVYHYGHVEFFRKFAEIFAAQGAPPVSLTTVANGKNFAFKFTLKCIRPDVFPIFFSRCAYNPQYFIGTETNSSQLWRLFFPRKKQHYFSVRSPSLQVLTCIISCHSMYLYSTFRK